MIHSSSSFFNRFSIQNVSQSSSGASEMGHLAELSSVTSESLSSRSSFDSLRLSPVARLGYHLVGIFSINRAQKLAESQIEGMVLARKAQLAKDQCDLGGLSAEDLQREIDALAETFQQTHPLGKAVPWMIEDVITNAFSKEIAVRQLIQKIENAGGRYQERLSCHSGNKLERKVDCAINSIYKHFVRRTAIGRENPELVSAVLLNYFKPEKAKEYIVNAIREDLQKIKETHPKAIFSRQQAENFVGSYSKDKSSYLVMTHKEAVMDMVLRELNIPKHELSEVIDNWSIPPNSLFAMKKISGLIDGLLSLDNEKDQEEMMNLIAQKIDSFKSVILESFSCEIINRSLSEKTQIPAYKLSMDFYVDLIVKEVSGTIKKQFRQEGFDCSHPLLKKLFSVDFDKFIYNHAIFSLFPAKRLDRLERNICGVMGVVGQNNESTLHSLFLESKIEAACLHCPKQDHFFVSEIIRYRANPEKSRLDFIKNSIKEFRFELGLSSDTSFENRERIVKRLGEKFAWHPIFKDCPLLKSLLFDQVLLQRKACRLDKNMFGLKNTLIFCEGSSDAYMLKNKLSDADLDVLRLQFPGADISRSANGKCVIGQGYFGKVRFAKNILTGCFVAVKKIRDQAGAREEVQKYGLVGKGKHLIPLYNVAELQGKDHALKTYLLMEYVNGIDGIDFLNSSLYHWSRSEKQKKLKSISSDYLRSVADLHQKGVYHCDIKPDNFMHARNGDIRLIDYGLCSNKIYQRGGATVKYASPEWLEQSQSYNGEKHDSFSLGVTLLYLSGKLVSPDKLMNLIDSLGETHHVAKSILAQSGYTPVFIGFEGISHLKGETIDEVIMLLMAKNPRERISPKRALALPFFTKTP